MTLLKSNSLKRIILKKVHLAIHTSNALFCSISGPLKSYPEVPPRYRSGGAICRVTCARHAVPRSKHVEAQGNRRLHTMTKATEAGLAIFASSAVYFAACAGVIPTGQLIHDEILPYLPWWALVTFGAYALGTLGWGVLTFKDKEANYRELLQQIDEAKAFYKTKGLDLDE